MKDNKKPIPFIKLLIAGSLIIFFSSLVYINYFSEEKSLELQKPVKPDKKQIKNQALREFNEYIHSGTRVSMKKTYTGDAFLKLQAVVKALADYTGYEFQYADMVLAESDADLIANEKSLSKRSFHIRHAAIVLASSIRKIQRQKYPALYVQTQELDKASTSFVETDPELDQNEKAQRFFLLAAGLLQKMD